MATGQKGKLNSNLLHTSLKLTLWQPAYVEGFDRCFDADERKTWGTQKGLIEKHI